MRLVLRLGMPEAPEEQPVPETTEGGHHGVPAGCDECRLIINFGDQEQEVDLAPVFFGRDAKNHVQLISPCASRFHAAVYRLGDCYVVRDLHSRNGITLNGRKVSVAPLRPGDVIGFDEETALVETATEPLGSYRDQGVVVFVDVKRYATLSERYGDSFVQNLREILEILEDHALRQQGCPVKNLGGGIMVTFGLWPVADRRYSVVDAALSFARHAVGFVPKAVQEHLNGEDHCDIHVGMALGRFHVSVDRGFDVTGDTVNLASRLQTLNRTYGTRIMMNKPVHDALKERSHIRELDTVCLKGLSEVVDLYSFDERSKVRQEATTQVTSVKAVETPLEYRRLYAEGLARYRAGDFAAAFETFDLCNRHYRDPPSRTMRERIVALLARKKEGTLGEWDGVWTLESR